MKSKSTLTRREFFGKSSAAALGGMLAASFPSAGRGQSADTPPNVVSIICDQMRGDALGCLGSPNARTPQLDRMASRGVLFENWFSNGPVCVPSRVSSFTGRYPHQHGNLTNKSGELIGSLEDSMLGYFRERGYKLGWIGKNHTYAKRVLDRLDVWKNRVREPFRRYNEFVPPWWHSDMYWPTEKCYATLNTTDSIEFIKNTRRDGPFFLHISYFDPHPPYFAPSEYTSRYSSEEMKIPPYVPPENLSNRLAEYQRAMHYDRIKDSDLVETMRYYYASIEWGVDYQVGRVLQALQDAGLAENTIVMFTADHGDFMGHHRMVRKGMFLYDSLLHVPMVWYAPGLIQQNHRVKNLAQGVDLFPTLVDLTGGEVPEELPGRSLKPFLQGETKEEDKFTIIASAAYSDLPENYFDHPEPLYEPKSDAPLHQRVQTLTWEAENKTAMARTRDWKLILNESHPPELYYMDGGTVEKKNVIDEPGTRQIRQELESKIQSTWSW